MAQQGETLLSTDFTLIQPTVGPPVPVTGGVFVFGNVTIPLGASVRGVGTRPMIWIVTGNFVVQGRLSVDGGAGEQVNTLNAANFPAAGGVGGPNGGNGGRGSPNTLMRSFFGETGFEPTGTQIGGGGGNAAAPLVGRGSGGGGGAFSSMGDPWFFPQPLAIPQAGGAGGFGGLGPSGAPGRTVPGGIVGTGPFQDQIRENNFWGIGYDVNRQRYIFGELPLPRGGQGGGGGGDQVLDYNPNSVQWINDSKGGGGGGGGGCLIVYAQGAVAVLGGGSITANGGHGGGGEQAGSCNQGGGGGAGSGGMLILASELAVVLEVRGETFANQDYDFVLSADGGVCRTGTFGTPWVPAKYPANGQPRIQAGVYDSAPLGGFGGMGIVQLMTRPGTNADGTNTVLDDGIVLLRQGRLLLGNDKRRYLAWRGWPNQIGQDVDDFGNLTNIGGNEGDIRPSPILLPLFR